jgi:hypothetical protein
MTYKWFKDSVPLTVDPNLSYRYKKAAADYSDAGFYKTEATNLFGTSSVTTVLRVILPVVPTFVNKDYVSSVTIFVGDSVSMSARAVGGGVKYRWYKNNVLIANTSDAYRLTATSPTKDKGQYKAEAYNSMGTISRVYSLTVLPMEIPKFSEPLADKTYSPGALLVLTAPKATGGGIKYRWYKDGVLIAGATSPTYSKPSVTKADAGVYKVEAYNAVGSDFESCTITVSASTIDGML